MAEGAIELVVGRKTFTDIEAGFREIDRGINTAFNKSARSISRLLRRSLNMIAAEMQERHGQPWREGGSPSDRLYRRTGRGIRAIRESIKVRDVNKLKDVRGSIRVKFPLSVHEHGATIRPRSAEYLTIPLPAAMDGRGVPRRRSAREWRDTFVARSRRGNLLIFQRRGTEIVPLYLLRREVQLPARLGFQETADKITLGFFEDRMFETLNREIDKALGL